ncbi:MAG: transglutaminase family protein [Chitinophagaceae bacterium]|nr:transglutaminase family protein [Chitinophagaceae bacterium]MCW5928723.1 transglutaminase family protein [Chitinophagaceae bacterium]
MEETREIVALMNLIDDPDGEVFDTVSHRIVSYGKNIIPNLEQLWESTPDELVQGKIELLIHRLHFQDLYADFKSLKQSDNVDLMDGLLAVARYQYPELPGMSIGQEFEKIRRNMWLELNNYLTALEQVNVINRIFYSYHKFKGSEISYQNPEEFLVNKLVETKRGNVILNGMVYQHLCYLLDVPVRAVNVPRQYLLAYFDNSYEYFTPRKEDSNIHFFIDPMNGHIYTHKDVETYLKRMGAPATPSYFRPLENKNSIRFLLQEFSRCFDEDHNRYKQSELQSLASLLAASGESDQ